ncbi:hypothetical protein KQI52_07835 [bacterium]|nr:hypothetical protein [bacterium]
MVLYPRTSSTILALLIVFILATLGPAYAAFPYLSAPSGQVYDPEYGFLTGADTTQTLSLSGSWQLNDGSDEWLDVQVPGSWPTGQGTVILRRQFNLSQDWAFNHHRIVFWGVRANAAVTLNGRLLKTSEGDWPRVIIDLPADLLRFDRPNDLQVELDDRLSARESIPLKPKLYDSQSWSGIFGDVLLLSGPPVTVEDVHWATQINEERSRADWTLGVDLRLHASTEEDSSSTVKLSVRAEIQAPGDSTRRATDPVEIELNSLQTQSVSLTGNVRNLQLWSTAQPRLYTVYIVITLGESEFTVPVRAGFRQIRWAEGQAYLNGQALEIRGIDYRQETVDAGGAISVRQIESDLSRIRNQGFNLVRIVGGVPHPATYSLCDRIGLMILPGTGLRAVPNALFVDETFNSRFETMLRREIESNDHHPSVVGWELLDWAEATPELFDVAERFRSRLLAESDVPLMIGFASDIARDLPAGIVGMRHRVPYRFGERLTPQSSSHGTWMVAGLGALASPLQLAEDSLQSEIRQSDALVRQINAVREMPVAGFIIDGFNDRRAALPLLIAGAQRDPGVIRRGLVTEQREERIAWQRVGDLLGQVRIDVPVVDVGTSQFPVEFPIATLIVGGLLLLVMRQNNVFRHNLRRVFAHTHGFFVDIVERRYFQGGQTFFIAIIFAAGQAVLLASLLNHSRFEFGLDYLFTLLFPFPQAKALMVYGAWHPIHAVLAFTAIILVLWLLGAFLLRILSIPFPGQFKLRHSIALTFWSATCFFPLIPLGLFFYRLLDFPWFQWVQILLFVTFWYWFLTRMVSVIRVGFRASSRTAWLLILILIAIGAGTITTVYRGGFAITDYVRYYSDVILPWLSGQA